MSDLMATQKRRSPRPPGSTPAGRVAILLEDIEGKVQATMEAVSGFREEFRSEIETLRIELCRRIEVLEMAVRENSEDIRKNSEDIRRNSEEIQSLRELLERRVDRDALVKLEARVQIIEQRLGIH